MSTPIDLLAQPTTPRALASEGIFVGDDGAVLLGLDEHFDAFDRAHPRVLIARTHEHAEAVRLSATDALEPFVEYVMTRERHAAVAWIRRRAVALARVGDGDGAQRARELADEIEAGNHQSGEG